MHTYSHAVYTWAVARFARREASHAAAAGAGRFSARAVQSARAEGQRPARGLALLLVGVGRAQPSGRHDARRGRAPAILALLGVAVEEPDLLLGSRLLRPAVPRGRARGDPGARLGISVPELPSLSGRSPARREAGGRKPA